MDISPLFSHKSDLWELEKRKLPVVAVEEQDDKDDDEAQEGHVEPVDLRPAAFLQKFIEALITFVHQERRQDDYSKKYFHQYSHMQIL
ncbi:MAG: hypothetical protein UY01_C0002G0028 [Candidatus Nomurabacteria bacterium GW2011_GWB1_47_6]|uniref:Uncharacterized protein n=1 Tax=Candidatus Nomurabacteria bacterium GW2011_GWB1_47_6 TaxID=1618749 RepID=A0A0G1W0Q5_9BACT|nr:MAG: hypothetical protein UY01_C0002G0028 [Candidatus Nomurabacteria bacterium GW2011_GWB1_47_6]